MHWWHFLWRLLCRFVACCHTFAEIAACWCWITQSYYSGKKSHWLLAHMLLKMCIVNSLLALLRLKAHASRQSRFPEWDAVPKVLLSKYSPKFKAWEDSGSWVTASPAPGQCRTSKSLLALQASDFIQATVSCFHLDDWCLGGVGWVQEAAKWGWVFLCFPFGNCSVHQKGCMSSTCTKVNRETGLSTQRSSGSQLALPVCVLTELTCRAVILHGLSCRLHQGFFTARTGEKYMSDYHR